MRELSTMLSKDDRAAVAEFTDRIKQKLGLSLVEIRLFGSKAKGISSTDSDIDVLIITKELDEKLKDIVFDIAVDVNLTYDVVIAPLIYPAEAYFNPLLKATYFYKATQDEGLIL